MPPPPTARPQPACAPRPRGQREWSRSAQPGESVVLPCLLWSLMPRPGRQGGSRPDPARAGRWMGSCCDPHRSSHWAFLFNWEQPILKNSEIAAISLILDYPGHAQGFPSCWRQESRPRHRPRNCARHLTRGPFHTPDIQRRAGGGRPSGTFQWQGAVRHRAHTHPGCAPRALHTPAAFPTAPVPPPRPRALLRSCRQRRDRLARQIQHSELGPSGGTIRIQLSPGTSTSRAGRPVPARARSTARTRQTGFQHRKVFAGGEKT